MPTLLHIAKAIIPHNKAHKRSIIQMASKALTMPLSSRCNLAIKTSHFKAGTPAIVATITVKRQIAGFQVRVLRPRIIRYLLPRGGEVGISKTFNGLLAVATAEGVATAIKGLLHPICKLRRQHNQQLTLTSMMETILLDLQKTYRSRTKPRRMRRCPLLFVRHPNRPPKKVQNSASLSKPNLPPQHQLSHLRI